MPQACHRLARETMTTSPRFLPTAGGLLEGVTRTEAAVSGGPIGGRKATAHVKRARPDRTWHGLAVADRILLGAVYEQCDVRVERRELEVAYLVACNDAIRTGDARDDTGLVGHSPYTDLYVVVGQEFLEKSAVAGLPRLP
jgi:hypothetical protein